MALLLGTRKGLLTLHEENGRWRVTDEQFPGAPISYGWLDSRNGTTWAAAAHGHWGTKLYRRKRGAEFEEVPGPAYPEGAAIRPDAPATVQYIWTITGGGEDHPERILMGTIPGGLFVSEDGGDTFELNETLWNHPTREKGWFGGGFDEAGIHSIAVDPKNSDRFFIGISCAGVFETTDSGSTWHIRNKGMGASFLPDEDAEVGFDPHRMVMHGGNPDVFWQQNHDGIFRSTDACLNWERVDEKGSGPAYFGFAIATDDQDPDTAWVVPAHSDGIRSAIDGKMIVCRTEDGGKNWKQFNNGLPDEKCYDLVYRHCLDYGNGLLAFGTTTGNLFVSTDRGESWQHAAGFLPPIYSVQIIDD